ncbi:MAG: nucleoside-diphosphate kinase [Rickettsiales bacterium]|jgi:nucleoside-diphosphate kinase|nr:nucleoside-diphosphate kinase [Rickettsiales bacterium]
MKEMTLSLIKPDAMERKLEGPIIHDIEAEDFDIVVQKKIVMTENQTRLFYREHAEKPFFSELVSSISGKPIVAQVLSKENAVRGYRSLIGYTDPQTAEEGTLRRKYGTDITRNALHGSDNIESSYREIHFFFSDLEIYI